MDQFVLADWRELFQAEVDPRITPLGLEERGHRESAIDRYAGCSNDYVKYLR